MNEQTQLTVTTHEAAPQLILGISKRIKVDALQDYFHSSCDRLTTFAASQPNLEVVGDAFGIYHGPVNHEDDGPMEVCLPVRGAAAPSGDIVLRELPGGPVAIATGTREQSEFPRVLEIYDAVAGWINSNGYTMDGPPREGWGELVTVTWSYRTA